MMHITWLQEREREKEKLVQIKKMHDSTWEQCMSYDIKNEYVGMAG